MEATSLPALGSLMARQICFLPAAGEELTVLEAAGAALVKEGGACL
jgi:hypothetical protein